MHLFISTFIIQANKYRNIKVSSPVYISKFSFSTSQNTEVLTYYLLAEKRLWLPYSLNQLLQTDQVTRLPPFGSQSSKSYYIKQY